MSDEQLRTLRSLLLLYRQASYLRRYPLADIDQTIRMIDTDLEALHAIR